MTKEQSIKFYFILTNLNENSYTGLLMPGWDSAILRTFHSTGKKRSNCQSSFLTIDHHATDFHTWKWKDFFSNFKSNVYSPHGLIAGVVCFFLKCKYGSTQCAAVATLFFGRVQGPSHPCWEGPMLSGLWILHPAPTQLETSKECPLSPWLVCQGGKGFCCTAINQMVHFYLWSGRK